MQAGATTAKIGLNDRNGGVSLRITS